MFRRQFWRENSNSKGKNYRIFQIFEFLCQNWSKMQLVWTSILARKNSNSKVEKNRIFQIIWIFMPKLFSNGIWRQFFAWKFKFKTGKKYFSNFSNIWIFLLKLIQSWQDKLKDFLMIFERFFMLNLASFKACKKVLSTIGMRTGVINLCELFTWKTSQLWKKR